MKQKTAQSANPTTAEQLVLGGKDEMNLAEFPLTKLGSRDQRDVLIYEGWGIDAQKRPLHQRWTVRGATGLGIPSELGDRVLLALFALNFQQDQRSRKVRFSRYQLLKLMQLDPEGKNCANLEHVLRQLTGITIESERAFFNKAQNKRLVSREAFHLIEKLWLRKYEIDHQVLADESTQGYIIWGKEIWDSLQAGYIKNIDLAFYYNLSSPLTRRLYRFLDKRMYYQDRTEIDVFELTGRLGQTPYSKPSEAFRKLKPAITQLIDAGFLVSGETVKKGKYTRVRFIKATMQTRQQHQAQQEQQAEKAQQLAWLHEHYQTTPAEQALEAQLYEQLKPMTNPSGYMMLTQCRLLSLRGDTAIIGCPNTIVQEWVQKHLSGALRQVLAELVPERQLKLTWVDLRTSSKVGEC